MILASIKSASCFRYNLAILRRGRPPPISYFKGWEWCLSELWLIHSWPLRTKWSWDHYCWFFSPFIFKITPNQSQTRQKFLKIQNVHFVAKSPHAHFSLLLEDCLIDPSNPLDCCTQGVIFEERMHFIYWANVLRLSKMNWLELRLWYFLPFPSSKVPHIF